MAANGWRHVHATCAQHETQLLRIVASGYRGGMGEIDVNGHPTDPDHPWNQDRPSLAERRDAGRIVELLRLERIWREDERVEALAIALVLCSEAHVALPDWAAMGVQQVLATLVRATPDYLMHYTRWDMVSELRDRKAELLERQQHEVPKAQKLDPTYEPRYDLQPTWEAAYENASKALAGTKYEGSADTIKKSYQLIERLFKSGARPYFIRRGKK